MPFCDICDKGPSSGNAVEQRGKAKYLGGNGRKTVGITRRKFQPNIQNVRANVDGKTVRMRVCVKCIRAGKIQKAVVREAFTIHDN